MMDTRTRCPYCGTENILDKQTRYVDTTGSDVFQCQLCKNFFTDLENRNKKQEELSTT